MKTGMKIAAMMTWVMISSSCSVSLRFVVLSIENLSTPTTARRGTKNMSASHNGGQSASRNIKSQQPDKFTFDGALIDGSLAILGLL